ncbi:head maturation protease, ClpP-related [Paracraurococcus lichenis]|uniref:ATP-dependent Clp protease proteolytic subunit n=1 Tax=Paracraurococcus lichenis TaxID=3064888 RepID=A0ABT9E8C3_9PROT|nr:head maturation protease, ClpP-related [Paracraurococcus sp. LOR1-02]MDO9712447.1 Clp protease ClpP [Paracraurococcus sp. LOR1-02]
MRKFAERVLAARPEALSLYASMAPEPGLSVRAAAADKPAELLIYDEIGYYGVTAKDVVKALAGIGDGPLLVRLNSPGGDIFDGLAIYNALKARTDVTVQIDGVAASAAAFIAMAGTKVTIAERAMMMLHNCWAFVVGNRHDLLEQAATMEKIDGQQAAMFEAKTGKNTAEIVAVLDAETWFTSTEAKTFGLVDEVLSAPAPAAAATGAPRASSHDIALRRARLRVAEAA